MIFDPVWNVEVPSGNKLYIEDTASLEAASVTVASGAGIYVQAHNSSHGKRFGELSTCENGDITCFFIRIRRAWIKK